MTLIAVPEDGSALDVLALRYRAAFDKIKAGREQWIEGTLELTGVIAEARKKIPDHREYNRWLERNELRVISPQNLSALNGFGQDLVVARELLTASVSISWEQIWRDRPNKPIRTPSESRKGPQRTFSRSSGSSKRKRRARIPTAMQEDNPEPKPERKAVILKAKTREEVDPDFKGTPLEFTTKYGHVTLHTKNEIEHQKSQEALSTWLGTMVEFERAARAAASAFAALEPRAFDEWQRRPGKAEKLEAWCKSIDQLLRALQMMGAH